MTPSDLAVVVESHRLWLTGKGGSRADLSGADLRGVDLRGVVLSDVDLSDADCEGVRWPAGHGWWQGGTLGPRGRMIRVYVHPDGAVVQAGCLTCDTPDAYATKVEKRRSDWTAATDAETADASIVEAIQLARIGWVSAHRQAGRPAA